MENTLSYSPNNKLKENTLICLMLMLSTILMVTIIGYFDEGHARIYGSFSNYIAQGGYPPINDYVLWIGILTTAGMICFNALSAFAPDRSLTLRALLTLLSVPFVFMFTVILLVIFIQIF